MDLNYRPQPRSTNPKHLLDDFMAVFKGPAARHRPETVLADFAAMAACAIANQWDHGRAAVREARYETLRAGYSEDDRKAFPELLAILTLLCKAEFADVFGQIWRRLDMKGKWNAQYFTPYEVSKMLAQLTMLDCQAVLDRSGLIAALEPACGAGSMVVAMADTVNGMGIDYRKFLHVTAQDIDPLCCHMTFVAASLYGIPAVVHQGDTLRGQVLDSWYTPMHVANDWSARLHAHSAPPPALAAPDPAH